MHPWDKENLVNAIVNKIKCKNNFIVLKEELFNKGYGIVFGNDYIKEVDMKVEEDTQFLSVFIYGYSYDEFQLYIQGESGEKVNISKLNTLKEDKFLMRDSTKFIVKIFRADISSPFFINLEFLNISKGVWKIGLKGDRIVDGRLLIESNEKNKWNCKMEKIHLNTNAVFMDKYHTGEYDEIKKIEINDKKTHEVRMKCFEMAMELAQNK